MSPAPVMAVQHAAADGEAHRPQVVLPVPQPLPHIIYQQLRLIFGVQHREIVLPVCASGHGAVILILPQRLGYPRGILPSKAYTPPQPW